MINVSQLSAALYGVWLVLKLDPRGFVYFEKTPEGFARSFLGAAVIAPFQLIHIFLIYGQMKPRLAFAPFVVVQMLAFLLSWVSYPFAMLYVGALLDRQGRYFWQMVPYNWLQLVISLPLVAVAILTDMHLVAPSLFMYFNQVVLIGFLFYGIFLARAGLQLGLGTALGVVVLDLLLTVLTSALIGRI